MNEVKRFRRIQTVALPLMGTMRFMVMSGAQRDQYITKQVEIRNKMCEASGMSADELAQLDDKAQTKVLTEKMAGNVELLREFNSMQYMLLAWCVIDENDNPMWATPEEASSSLDYEQANELANACTELNKLTAEAKKDKQLDFFDTQKSETGSS